MTWTNSGSGWVVNDLIVHVPTGDHRGTPAGWLRHWPSTAAALWWATIICPIFPAPVGTLVFFRAGMPSTWEPSPLLQSYNDAANRHQR